MIPRAFSSKYPCLAAVLTAAQSHEQNIGTCDRTAGTAAANELSAACDDKEGLVELTNVVFGCQPRPDAEFMRFTMAAYDRLRASESSRIFLGRIWAEAARTWSSGERATFLSLLLRDDQALFEALDIGTELFRRVRFTADEMFPWISDAHRRAGNAMYQRGFWGSIEALCSTSTDAAITAAGRWLDARPPAPSLNVVSNMLSWLRNAVRSDGSAGSHLVQLEARLRAGGHPAWRAAFIHSCAGAGGSSHITESEALQIRDCYVSVDSDEERAWCFLLSSVVQTQKASWDWAHRELMAVARPTLGEDSKHWVGVAALFGVQVAEQGDTVPPSSWRELFRALLPLAESSVMLWQGVLSAVTALADKDGSAMRELIRVIAADSAPTWLQILRSNKLAPLFQTLREKKLAQGVSTDLCFSSGASLRRLGIIIFDECAVQEFDASVVGNATPVQIELLLLEAQRRQIGHDALARLHACLADRIDEIGANLPELFYEEVSRQCMNTHRYRVALASARPGNEYLQAMLADVHERLTVIRNALNSPVIRMEVPGQVRAQKLHDRRLLQEVSKSIKEHSTFVNLFPNIHVLYGGMEPRVLSREGALSPPVQMHSSSSSVEIPRLEFLDPEGAWLRRVAAAVRVNALEPNAKDGNNDQ